MRPLETSNEQGVGLPDKLVGSKAIDPGLQFSYINPLYIPEQRCYKMVKECT